jgi:hypothetical protein
VAFIDHVPMEKSLTSWNVLLQLNKSLNLKVYTSFLKYEEDARIMVQWIKIAI